VTRWWLGLLLVACGADEAAVEPAADPVVCADVVAETLPRVLTLRGPLRAPPDHEARVAPQIAGTVSAVLVREGDRVVAGQALLRLDGRVDGDLVAAAASTARDASAALDAARAARSRAEALLAGGFGPQRDVDRAVADEARAAAVEEGARAALAAARTGHALASVTSPIAGLVSRVGVRAGERVDGALPLVDVVDAGALELVAAVPAWQLVQLAPGLSATVRVDGAEVAATVTAVGASVAPDTGLGAVRLALDSPLGVPGALGVADVVLAEPETVLTAPRAAFVQADDGVWSTVRCAGPVARVEVTLGADRPHDQVIVTTGLTAGDRVVLGGGRGLVDGDPLAAP